ncbi:hypothetical protein AAFF_G00429010 [Aldrovandia affinis]|uniref:Uncharacterized protein n=1 Tax=Aldrovandia affinis TaxID=143900 RepID=A0AAD7SBL5_9TELE|nr:hypothetical protein AAFF_G00429010 [Aldrovandia affinis]
MTSESLGPNSAGSPDHDEGKEPNDLEAAIQEAEPINNRFRLRGGGRCHGDNGCAAVAEISCGGHGDLVSPNRRAAAHGWHAAPDARAPVASRRKVACAR